MDAAYIALSIICTVLCTLYILWRYAQRDTPWWGYIVALGYFLPFETIALIPLDVQETLSVGTQKYLLDMWNFVFWTQMVITWLIFPTVLEVVRSGEFTWKGRGKAVFRRQMKFYAVAVSLGLAFLMYLAIVKGLTGAALVGFVIACANAWGLFLLIILLGFGLVEVPRRLWHLASFEQNLNDSYFAAVAIEDAHMQAKFDVDDVVKLVWAASQKVRGSDPLRPFVDVLVAKMPMEDGFGVEDIRLTSDVESDLGEVTYERLVKLHATLKDKVAQLHRSQHQWDELVDKTCWLEDVIASRSSPHQTILSTLREPRDGFLAAFRDRLEWHLYVHFWPIGCRLLAVLCALMSLLVVIGETTLYFNSGTGFHPFLFSNLLRRDYGAFITKFVCALPLGFIAYCTWYSLFKIKVPGWYGLYRHKHTDTGSLIFVAETLCRLSAPLAYNFINMIDIPNGITFHEVMGKMNTAPVLGKDGFNNWFPTLLLLFVLLHLLRVFNKLLRTLGLSNYAFTEDKQNLSRIGEGKDMLARARQKKEREIGTGPQRGGRGTYIENTLRKIHNPSVANVDQSPLRGSQQNIRPLTTSLLKPGTSRSDSASAVVSSGGLNRIGSRTVSTSFENFVAPTNSSTDNTQSSSRFQSWFGSNNNL
eukprot:GILK01007896.1.p1 GENE.GILK01007896.1~~GILK01007896.1.p1  ORF type:complete len:660 (-),score=88.83 GILK01007896.1:177-2114(-)